MLPVLLLIRAFLTRISGSVSNQGPTQEDWQQNTPKQLLVRVKQLKNSEKKRNELVYQVPSKNFRDVYMWIGDEENHKDKSG